MIPEVQEMLGFNCVAPIKTVYGFLEERKGLKLLHEEIILIATREIIPDGKTRSQIQLEIKRKEKAVESLSRKYQSRCLSADEIRHCLYSIGDNNAYLRANRYILAISIIFKERENRKEKKNKNTHHIYTSISILGILVKKYCVIWKNTSILQTLNLLIH